MSERTTSEIRQIQIAGSVVPGGLVVTAPGWIRIVAWRSPMLTGARPSWKHDPSVAPEAVPIDLTTIRLT